MKPTITIELDVDQASYLHAMINPNFFLSSEPLTDMEKAGYNLGLELRNKLATFVQENY
jgi:hypothetical protein